MKVPVVPNRQKRHKEGKERNGNTAHVEELVKDIMELVWKDVGCQKDLGVVET